MDQFRRFGRPALVLLLLLPLFLMGLTGCDECNEAPPDLDPSLLSENGLIYFNSSLTHSLYAIAMDNGSIRWTYQGTGDTFLDKGILYLSGSDDASTLTALDARNGSVLWQNTERDGASPAKLVAAINHIAYIFTGNGMLKAVNGRDGSLLWQHLIKEEPLLSVKDAPAALYVINGVVYISTITSSIYALREQDGAELWRFDRTVNYNDYPFNGITAIGDGMIFVSADQTYALRLSDGKILWHWAQRSKLLEANGMLYLNARRALDPEPIYDDIYVLRARDGTQVWHRSFAPTSPSDLQSYSMQLIDNELYIFPAAYRHYSSYQLFALRARDGTLLWKRQFGGTALVGFQGLVYIFAPCSQVEALRETDGATVWSSHLPQCGLFITNGAIYMGTAGNSPDHPCGFTASAELEKLRLSDVSLLWHIKFDPVPDPFPSTKITLFILLGGLLSGLALFVLRKRQKNTWLA